MSSQDPIVIVSAARTPIGGLLGDFASLAQIRGNRKSTATFDTREVVRLPHAQPWLEPGCEVPCPEGRTHLRAL